MTRLMQEIALKCLSGSPWIPLVAYAYERLKFLMKAKATLLQLSEFLGAPPVDWDALPEPLMHIIFNQINHRTKRSCRLVSKYWKYGIDSDLRVRGSVSLLRKRFYHHTFIMKRMILSGGIYMPFSFKGFRLSCKSGRKPLECTAYSA